MSIDDFIKRVKDPDDIPLIKKAYSFALDKFSFKRLI